MTPFREREIRETIAFMRCRLTSGEFSMSHAAARLSLPMSEDLLEEVDRLRRLPVIEVCGQCASCSYDTREDGQRSRWVCRYGNRFVSRDEAPPEWCPLRGAR